MFYHHTNKNKNQDFDLIKKFETNEWLAEGMVKLTNNTLTSVDLFPSTIIFNNDKLYTHTTFTIGDGNFIMGICDIYNPYTNILVNLEYGGVSIDGLQNCVRMAEFPSVKKGDVIRFIYHTRALYLDINDDEYKIYQGFDLESIITHGKGIFKIFCYMESRVKKWNCEQVFASISF